MFSLTKTLVTSNPMTQLVFTLNAAAVTDIQKQIVARQEFVIAGDVTSVPEPSSWMMMLAGFAGLGLRATPRGQAPGRGYDGLSRFPRAFGGRRLRSACCVRTAL
jgi:hypothetical protein